MKRNALKKIVLQVEQVNLKVKGRYSQSFLKEIATFDIKLPDFCGSRCVTIRAYVEDKSIGRHDIVLGVRFIKQLGLIFDFKRSTVMWDNITTPMRQHGSITPDELLTIDAQDVEAPEIFQRATQRMERAITSNDYSSHNYQTMIFKCTHLTSNQQDTLLELFKNYSSLFDGTLGKVPNVKIHLDLKPNSKPFCARAYKIPHNILEIARKEVEELCRIGVLEANVYSEWGAPCLFRAKKSGGVRFLTDLRQLNKCLVRKPVHLPLIDEVIWKVQGFTFATCLDLNRGYYHFELEGRIQKFVWNCSSLGPLCICPPTTRMYAFV